MSITVIIVLVTLVVSFYAWNREEVMRKLIMEPYAINKNKEYYRLVTSGFIHADYIHLFFNLLGLYSFGQFVEVVFLHHFHGYGTLAYILFYLLAIVVSDLPTYIKNKNNYRYASLGASGGVSALIIVSIIFNPFHEIYFFFIPMPGVVMGILYITYSYYMGKRQFDNINHDAHLYGALFGIVTVCFLFPHAVIEFYQLIIQKLGM